MSSGQAVVVSIPLSDEVHRRFNRGPRPALAGAGEEKGLRTLGFLLSRAQRCFPAPYPVCKLSVNQFRIPDV